MKSLMFRLFVVVVLLFATIVPCMADKTTGLQTASAVYATGKTGGIYSIDIIHDGTNSCTVEVYSGNGVVASSSKFKGFCYATVSSSCSKEFIHPRRFSNGFYISISGTGCSYIVTYELNI